MSFQGTRTPNGSAGGVTPATRPSGWRDAAAWDVQLSNVRVQAALNVVPTACDRPVTPPHRLPPPPGTDPLVVTASSQPAANSQQRPSAADGEDRSDQERVAPESIGQDLHQGVGGRGAEDRIPTFRTRWNCGTCGLPDPTATCAACGDGVVVFLTWLWRRRQWEGAAMRLVSRGWRAAYTGCPPQLSSSNRARRKFLSKWSAQYQVAVAAIGSGFVASSETGFIEGSAGQKLLSELRSVTQTGKKPAWTDPAALDAYANVMLPIRVQKLPGALVLRQIEPLLTSLLFNPGRHVVRMVAVGGGPGFEFLGLVALARQLHSSVSVECLVTDIAPGWLPVLQRLVGEANRIGYDCDCKAAGDQHQGLRHTVQFAVEDCCTTSSRVVQAAIDGASLFVYNYVLVENARALREEGFWPLRRTFRAAGIGSVFVFMDASHHLWTEVSVAMAAEGRFAVIHPRPQPWQCVNTFLAVKLELMPTG
eukprot:m.20691 g.20691  ORF g.20691 m.20691 type:complete len:478 (+) comp5602_c0_seq1:60-1493(+)